MTSIASQCSFSGHLTQDGWPCDTFEMLGNHGSTYQDCTGHLHSTGYCPDCQRPSTPQPHIQLPNHSQSCESFDLRGNIDDTQVKFLSSKEISSSTPSIKRARLQEVCPCSPRRNNSERVTSIRLHDMVQFISFSSRIFQIYNQVICLNRLCTDLGAYRH